MARSMTVRFSAALGHLWGHLGGHLRRRTRGEDGFTLVESLVTLTIFMIISLSAIWGLIKIVQITGITTDRVTATNLATQELERMRDQSNAGQQVDSAEKCTPVSNCQVTLHGTTFTVTPSLNPDPHVIGSTTCSSTDSTANVAERQISVVVSWGGTPSRSVRLDSVLTC